MRRYRMTLRPLTAVHIGTGTTISPLEYAIRLTTSKEQIFLRFHPEKVVDQLDDGKRKRFMELAASTNTAALRTFLAENATINAAWYAARITSAFAREYGKRQSDEANSLEVEENYRAPSQQGPVIPGSSIKGALRTGLLNRRVLARTEKDQKYLDDRFNRFDTQFQQWALGYTRPNDDPFRALSIGDCAFPPRDTQLVARLMQFKPARPDSGNFDSMAIYAEVICGALTGAGIESTTDLLFDDELEDYKAPEYGTLRLKAGKRVIDNPISIEEIVEACDDFYLHAFDSEFDTFFRKAEDDAVYASGQRLATLVDDLDKKKEHLLRVGRWSHVEAVTVEGYRKPLTRKGYGKTRTLLEYEGAYFPMGWCSYSIEEL